MPSTHLRSSIFVNREIVAAQAAGEKAMKIDTTAEGISSRERFLEAIVQSAIDYAIISLDLDGLVTSWNEGAFRILGWSPEEMIGRPATVFFTQEDREHGIPQVEMTSALSRGRGSDERWHLRKDGSVFWASGEMMALRAEDGTAIGFIKILRDKTQERDQADRQRLLMHELGHRMKNTLSVVQSIATQTLRNASSLEDAAQKLHARVAAYAKAHDILLQKDWTSATLTNIVVASLVNIGMDGSDRIHWQGPELELGPQTALSFSMVLHELLTNACKYGALSNSDGRVEIMWRIERRDGADFLLASWRETGGPPIRQPTSKGFGSRLIASTLKSYGEVETSYGPDGFQLVTRMPLANVQFRNDLAAIDGS
jgi:PAS domain S-box-containing protein